MHDQHTEYPSCGGALNRVPVAPHHQAAYLVPAPEVDRILAGLCCHKVVMAQAAQAVAAAAVGFVLAELRACADIPAATHTR